MTTAAIGGRTTELRIGSDVIGAVSPSATYTFIAEVTSISGPSISMDTTDVTTMESGYWREFEATLNDGGEVNLDINYVPSEATHNNSDSTTAGLIYLLDNQVLRGYQLAFPQESPEYIIEFNAWMTSFEISVPVDDVVTASATLRVTGAPTFGA